MHAEHPTRRFFLFSLLLFCAGGAGRGDTPSWKIRSSVTWISGDYGTGIDSKLLYIPYTLQHNLPAGRWSVTVPYIWSENTVDVAVFGGVPEGGNPGDEEGETVRESYGGMGDILLRGTYYLAKPGDLRDWAPGIDLSVDVKFPTANEKKGLGTGELDVGAGFGLYQWLNMRWIFFADFTYRFIGNPPGQRYDDQWVRGAGAGYRYSPDWIHSLYLEHRTAVTPQGKAALSLLYAVTYSIHQDMEWVGGLEIGLSDSAPDYSLNFGFSYTF